MLLPLKLFGFCLNRLFDTTLLLRDWDESGKILDSRFDLTLKVVHILFKKLVREDRQVDCVIYSAFHVGANLFHFVILALDLLLKVKHLG